MNQYTPYDVDLAAFADALAHPARVQLLRRILRRGPTTVGDLVAELPLGQPSVSRHLKVLRDAGLLDAVRRGRHVRYEAAPRAVRRLGALIGGLVATLP